MDPLRPLSCEVDQNGTRKSVFNFDDLKAFVLTGETELIVRDDEGEVFAILHVNEGLRELLGVSQT
jgi:hypothetical protein